MIIRYELDLFVYHDVSLTCNIFIEGHHANRAAN